MKALLVLLGMAGLPALAQPTVHWMNVGNGGAGWISGGRYALEAEIGAYSGILITGGAYTLRGGMGGSTAQVPVETPPRLRIIPNGSRILLAWPASAVGYQLQESPSLMAADWTDLEAESVIVGDEVRVSLQPMSEERYYRLRR